VKFNEKTNGHIMEEPLENLSNTIEKQLRTMLTHISGMWDIKGRNFGNLEIVNEQSITKGRDSEY
jgi:hypothetical protein